MTALGYHSTTSMAVKAVVAEVKNRLSKKFDFLKGMPEFFYDFNKGVSDQFKQYYAKIPERDRTGEWIALSYSYDSVARSTVQPRNGFSYYRPVTENLKRRIAFQYVELPLLFSILTNSSKCLNGLANVIGRDFDWSFTVEYEDVLWPEWKSDVTVPVGWYIRPKKPNGYLYMCSKTGVTGSTEPEWSTEETYIDNTVEWKSLVPERLKVKAGSFVKNDTVITNPIENGIMYQYDFGFTLHYTDYDDDGDLVGIIDEVTLKLLDYYREGFFSEEITTKRA